MGELEMAEAPSVRAGSMEPAGAEILWLRMVPHSDLLRRLAEGWVVSDELHGTNHGNYSVLGVWAGEGEPR